MVAERRHHSFEEFLALPDNGNLHEYVRGAIREIPPPKGMHGVLESALLSLIDRYLESKALHLGWDPEQGLAARRGVLFLDELPEFSQAGLEVLRQPLEDGTVTISRVNGSVTFPAKFMLVGAMNPCPCGYAGDSVRECTCSPGAIAKYQHRLSGPPTGRSRAGTGATITRVRDSA